MTQEAMQEMTLERLNEELIELHDDRLYKQLQDRLEDLKRTDFVYAGIAKHFEKNLASKSFRRYQLEQTECGYDHATEREFDYEPNLEW